MTRHGPDIPNPADEHPAHGRNCVGRRPPGDPRVRPWVDLAMKPATHRELARQERHPFPPEASRELRTNGVLRCSSHAGRRICMNISEKSEILFLSPTLTGG